MKESFDASKEFDNWVDKWDKAVSSGLFKDAPKPPSTSTQTSDNSFFGLRQDNPTDAIDPTDALYWNAISSVADGGVEIQRLDEVVAVNTTVKDGPNPVRRGTEGKDQDLSSQSLSLTFDEKDIKDLEEMKLKLHDLENKMAKMDDKDYTSQVKAIIKKIEDLSDKMGRVKEQE